MQLSAAEQSAVEVRCMGLLQAGRQAGRHSACRPALIPNPKPGCFCLRLYPPACLPACRCLQIAAQEHSDNFSPGCLAAVGENEARASSDYRLNFRLKEACSAAVDRWCPDACGALERECGCEGCLHGRCFGWEHQPGTGNCSAAVAALCVFACLLACLLNCLPPLWPLAAPCLQARLGAAAACCSAWQGWQT